MDTKQLPIGRSDFKQVIENNYYYVDKSLFIKEIIDKSDSILLIPRPRRFGKTLNLSMMKYFYDCCPESSPANGCQSPGSIAGDSLLPNSYKNLFASLAIAKAGQKYLEHMGKYPVIFLSFRSIKERTWDACWSKIKKLMQDEYARHYYLVESQKLMPFEES